MKSREDTREAIEQAGSEASPDGDVPPPPIPINNSDTSPPEKQGAVRLIPINPQSNSSQNNWPFELGALPQRPAKGPSDRPLEAFGHNPSSCCLDCPDSWPDSPLFMRYGTCRTPRIPRCPSASRRTSPGTSCSAAPASDTRSSDRCRTPRTCESPRGCKTGSCPPR